MGRLGAAEHTQTPWHIPAECGQEGDQHTCRSSDHTSCFSQDRPTFLRSYQCHYSQDPLPLSVCLFGLLWVFTTACGLSPVVVRRHVGSSQIRDQTCVPFIDRQTLNHWAPREVPLPPTLLNGADLDNRRHDSTTYTPSSAYHGPGAVHTSGWETVLTHPRASPN